MHILNLIRCSGFLLLGSLGVSCYFDCPPTAEPILSLALYTADSTLRSYDSVHVYVAEDQPEYTFAENEYIQRVPLSMNHSATELTVYYNQGQETACIRVEYAFRIGEVDTCDGITSVLEDVTVEVRCGSVQATLSRLGAPYLNDFGEISLYLP